MVRLGQPLAKFFGKEITTREEVLGSPVDMFASLEQCGQITRVIEVYVKDLVGNSITYYLDSADRSVHALKKQIENEHGLLFDALILVKNGPETTSSSHDDVTKLSNSEALEHTTKLTLFVDQSEWLYQEWWVISHTEAGRRTDLIVNKRYIAFHRALASALAELKPLSSQPGKKHTLSVIFYLVPQYTPYRIQMEEAPGIFGLRGSVTRANTLEPSSSCCKDYCCWCFDFFASEKANDYHGHIFTMQHDTEKKTLTVWKGLLPVAMMRDVDIASPTWFTRKGSGATFSVEVVCPPAELPVPDESLSQGDALNETVITFCTRKMSVR